MQTEKKLCKLSKFLQILKNCFLFLVYVIKQKINSDN